MTRSSFEAGTALNAVNNLPYGATRSAAALAEVEQIEAEGPAEVLAYAYNTLVDSYVWGEEVDKAFVPFTRALRLYDERPDLFDEQDSHSLFWSFKWMTGHLIDFPTVTAEQIAATLADMEQRFAVSGRGMNAVRLSAYKWLRHSSPDDAAVDAAYDAWVATPRDDYSQCEACEPGDRAAYLVDVGRSEEAARLIESVLPDDPHCATEPADMLSYLQLAYLELGDVEGVRRAHFRGVRHLDGPYDLSGPTSRYVEVLARTGNTERALRMLERIADVVTGSRDPGARLAVLTHVGIAARVLEADEPRTAVSLPGVPASDVAGLAAWVDVQADEIAAAFDARNGNDVASRHLADARERAGRTLDVDLGVLSFDAAPAAGAAPAAASEDDSDEDVVERLLEAAAEAEEDEPLAAAGLYREAAREAEAAGLLHTAGIALAEAAALAARLDDHDGAATGFRRALALLVADEVDPRDIGQIARAAARSTTRDDDVTALLGTIDRLVAQLTEPAADAATAPGHGSALPEREVRLNGLEALELRDTRARLLATVGRFTEAAAEARATAEAHRAAGVRVDEAHATWLLGKSLAAAGDLAGSLEPLAAAATLFSATRQTRLASSVSDEALDVLGRLGRADEGPALLARIADDAR
ncbi:hypothetical protein [Sanguibacter sp. HDW7]|uniref:hypothetical protein n=1 Tax=Sanguibacter sp. HDW7 TaxID=2714931 RepID=UPI001407B081|nr:hypothetical protein [Sanguibacter sp. HDW7]QIK83285.1 hypothetical protein G7063_06325 [Sanguibacter sp. HDW7]